MQKYKTKILSVIIVFLFIWSLGSSIKAYDYYEEYTRVQDELIEISVTNQELESEIIKLRTEPRISYIEYSVPFGYNSFKSWMPHKAVSKSSKQGKIISTAKTDENGLLKINDCYVVALGTYYGELGDIFKITTSSGKVFRVIKADVKADEHTDSSHRYTTANGCMMEFIVNADKLNSSIKTLGCVKTKIISGDIIRIEKESY